MSETATNASPSVSQVSPSRISREFEWIARLIVGGILVWSGSAHLANPYYFLSTVYQYELTTAPIGALVAAFMPFLELVLAACLLSGCCQRAAWSLTSLMLLGFVSVQGSALYRGLKISCGCFGPEINRPIDATSITYTAVLALLSIGAWLGPVRIVEYWH
jgi:uncharacterized membrane protein YphA (DoxX/SURF4 family)